MAAKREAYVQHVAITMVVDGERVSTGITFYVRATERSIGGTVRSAVRKLTRSARRVRRELKGSNKGEPHRGR